VDIAVAGRIDGPRLVCFETKAGGVMCINGARIRSLGRGSVRCKFHLADLVGKLFTFREKIDIDPADMVFRLVGMGNFLPDRHLNFEEFSFFHGVRGLDKRNVLFSLPVSGLEETLKICHENLLGFYLTAKIMPKAILDGNFLPGPHFIFLKGQRAVKE
jgi:hypothetical protein